MHNNSWELLYCTNDAEYITFVEVVVKRLLSLLVLCTGIFCLSANPVLGSPLNIRSNLNVDYPGSFAQSEAGSSIHVWSDLSSGSRDIYAMKVDAYGQNMWPLPIAITASPGNQDNPIIIRHSENEYIIIYEDYQNNQTCTLRAAKINHNGVHYWGAEGVSVADLQSTKANVHYLIQGVNTIIIWEDDSGPHINIHGQKLNSNGLRMWGENGVQLTFGIGRENITGIYPDGTDGFRLVYNPSLGSSYSILTMIYNANATMQWAVPVQLHPQLTYYQAVSSLYIPDQGLYLAVKNPNSGTSPLSLMLISTDWENAGIVQLVTTGYYIYPPTVKMCLSSDGQILMGWIRSDVGGIEVTLQTVKLDAQAEIIWEASELSLAGYSFALLLSPDDDGGVYQAWALETPSNNYQIGASFITQNNIRTWTNDKVVYSDSRLNLKAVSNFDDRFRIVCQGHMGAEYGAFYQDLNNSGTPIFYEGPKELVSGLSGKVVFQTASIHQADGHAFHLWIDSRAERPGLYCQIVDYDNNIKCEENGRYLGDCIEGRDFYDAIITPEGQLALVWIDEVDSSTRYLRAQLIDPDGGMLWGPEGIVVSNSFLYTGKISYVYGSIYVAWSRWNATGKTINLQKITDGNLEWDPQGIVLFSETAGQNLSTIGPMDGAYLLLSFVVNDGWGFEYRILRFNPDGSLPWNGGYIPISNLPQRFSYGFRTHSVGDDIIVSWADYINQPAIGSQLITQRVSADGVLTDPNGRLILDISAYEIVYDSVISNEGIVHVYSHKSADATTVMSGVSRHDLDLEPVWNKQLDLGSNSYQIFENSLSAYSNGILGIGWRSVNFYSYDLFRYNLIDSNGDLMSLEPYVATDLNNPNYNCATSALGVDGFALWDDLAYRYHARCPDYEEDFLGLYVQRLNVQTMDLEPDTSVPALMRLAQNYPNPFNPQTTISFDLQDSGPVNLGIYNLKGQLVRSLVNEHRSAGSHSVIWDGKDEKGASASSGIYLYRIKAGKSILSRKMMLMK